jgi:hypothetical protein
MKASTPASLLTLMILACATMATAFVTVNPPPIHTPTPFRLQHDSVVLRLSSIDSTELITMDLPKKALPFREEAENRQALLGLEVMVGRVAMIAALVFFVVEVTTDTSIPAQIEQLATVAMLS